MCDETDEEGKAFQQTKQKEEEKILNNRREESKKKWDGKSNWTGNVCEANK